MAIFIDITYPVSEKLPKWPGSIGYTSTRHLQIPPNINNSSSIQMDCHFGTHVDAPLHFVERGKSVEQLDFNKLIGEVYVSEIRGIRSIPADILTKKNIPKDCKRLLLKTDNQEYWEKGMREFQEDFCSIDSSGAQWVVDMGVELIGIDYLSIQRYHDSTLTHTILLENEVVILETLNLERVNPGKYELICLPIKLVGLEAAPIRALLRKL